MKNYNGSNKINLEVLLKSEDLFSATGYLGEAPQLSSTYAQYDNGYKVFNGSNSYYDNFVNNTSLSAWVSGSPGQNGNMPYADDGLWLNTQVSGSPVDFHLPIDFNFNNSYFITYGSGYNISDSFLRWGYGCLPTEPTAYLDGANYFVIANNTVTQGISSFTTDVNQTYYFYYENGVFYAVSSTQSVHSEFLPNASLSSRQIAGQLDNGNAYWSYVAVADVLNNDMPTFTIGSAYHPLSSFSISSNSLVVNTTFMEHNLTGYQYYAFSPVYNGDPVWFLVNGQIGDRLSVLLDSNVSLTVQILGYSYSNIIKEVKVE